MKQYSAQSSISVKRLRNGNSIHLSLELKDRPLYQAYDSQTGAVSPDWTIPSNQPVIIPHISTTRELPVVVSGHSWKYNGNILLFNGASSGGFVTDSTGKFAMDPANGSLKIIGNLASETNMASDTLYYLCVVSVDNAEYPMNKSIDVQIQQAGASSYYGFIKASSTQLDSNTPSVTLTSELWLAATPVDSYYIKWYKGDVLWAENNGHKSIEVSRADVNGSQVIIAEFYRKESDQEFVFRFGMTLIDTLDDIILVPYISSQNKAVEPGKPVTVSARIIRAKDNSEITPENPSWKYIIMDGDTWEELARVNTPTVQITTEHTDKSDGSIHDVEVLVEVEY